VKKIAEIFAVLLIGFIITFYFFGDVIKDINHIYFAQSGDGAKDYYTMIYHIKHDTSYLHSGAMNYPYGDNIFFCGAQPLLTNCIKFFSNNICDISDYAVGIHNISILISLCLTVLIIFLIFRKLSVGFWYSIIVSSAITFLSPQIDRIGGHFSLSYTFFIPLLIYCILQFNQKTSFLKSFFISLFFIVASFTHGYFMVFFTVVLVFFWIYRFYDTKPKNKQEWLHLLIQILIPIILVQTLTIWADNVNDRTAWPWGFLSYRSYPESVFISMSRPYWSFLNRIVTVRNVPWEGIAYVGLVSSIGFFYLFSKAIRKMFLKQFNHIILVTDNVILNILFWASFCLLLFSFGIPFIAKLEFLLEYLGPLRQFRSIGRFTWLFYYVINIIVFYEIWKYSKSKKYFKFFLIIFLGIVIYDSWFNCKSTIYYINNHLPEFDYSIHNKDIDNSLFKEYQTIMPIPYFNNGSENISVNASCPTLLKSYTFSLISGIPLNATNMSRTSISQCINNIQLIKDPYKKYNGLNYYKTEKPILLFVDTTCNLISKDEQNLIKVSKRIGSIYDYQLRKLYIKDITQLISTRETDIINRFNTISNPSTYIFYSYDSLITRISYYGTGALKVNDEGYTKIFSNTLFPLKNHNYKCSFWVYGMTRDIVPRNSMKIALGNARDNWYEVVYITFKDYVVAFDKDWALIEFEFSLKNENDYIKFTIMPLKPDSKEVYIDNLLIRPFNQNIMFKVDSLLFFNNLYFK
jgi:hypothetical protein